MGIQNPYPIRYMRWWSGGFVHCTEYELCKHSMLLSPNYFGLLFSILYFLHCRLTELYSTHIHNYFGGQRPCTTYASNQRSIITSSTRSHFFTLYISGDRTSGERSVMAGVSRRSNQNSNWMWWAYRSSDSSRQCHSVAYSTADRLSGLRQSYHPQHTLHELRARPFYKIHRTVNLYSTTSESDSKVSKNRAPSSNTAAVTWLLAIR